MKPHGKYSGGCLRNMIALALLVTWAAITGGDMAWKPEFSDSGVPPQESAIVAKLYTDAQAKLRATVMDPLGTTQGAKDFRRGRASAMITQVDQVIKELKISRDTWIGKKAPDVYKLGKKIATDQAKEAGITPRGKTGVKGSFNLIDQRAVAVLARDMAANLNKAADSMGDRAKRVLRGIAKTGLSEDQLRGITNKVDSGNRAAVTAAIDQRISERAAEGVINGAPRETIKALAEDLAGIYGDTVKIIDKNGDPMEFSPRDYAELVIRTRTREAMEAARHERLTELGIDLVAIVGKVSDTFCTAFLGQVFSLSGKSDKYDALADLPGGGPPFHPRCSKSTRPFIEELATPEQLEAAKGPSSGDSDKLVGMDQAAAQKAYKSLQIREQVEDRYRKSGGKPVVVETKPEKTDAKPTPARSNKVDQLVTVREASGFFAGDRQGSEKIPKRKK